jgi:hypothetical protein
MDAAGQKRHIYIHVHEYLVIHVYQHLLYPACLICPISQRLLSGLWIIILTGIAWDVMSLMLGYEFYY